ncbi:MAG: hypothetical protein ACK4WH_02050 [Phycisphaerales bacterium]
MSNAPANSNNNVFTKGFIPGLIVGLLVGLAVGVFMPAIIGPTPAIKPNPNPPKRVGPSERDPVPTEETRDDPAATPPATPPGNDPATDGATPKP